MWTSSSCVQSIMTIFTKSFFFIISQSFKVLLKTNTNFCPCLFRFFPVFIHVIHLVPQHRPVLHQRPQFYVEIKIAHHHRWKKNVSVFYWHWSGRWSLGYSRVKTGMCERVYKQHLHHCWLSYRPTSAASRQPAGMFPAGQTTGLCEYAYAFLYSTTLSGDKRNLPAGRKPERVNEALLYPDWLCGPLRISDGQLPGIKCTECESHLWPPSIADIINVSHCTYTPFM